MPGPCFPAVPRVIWGNSSPLNDDSEIATLPMAASSGSPTLRPCPRQAFLLRFAGKVFPEERWPNIPRHLMSARDTPGCRYPAERANGRPKSRPPDGADSSRDETFNRDGPGKSWLPNLGHTPSCRRPQLDPYDALVEPSPRQEPLPDPWADHLQLALRRSSAGLIVAVNALLKTFEVPGVFSTAYPEALLTGEKNCPEPGVS